jgi:molecular chaperone Hsp33
MIQMMPGADEKIISTIEAALGRMPQATMLIREGSRPVDLLRAALGDIEYETLDQKPVSFTCSCSHERAVSMISSIGSVELESMLREDHGAVLTCHFCNETYRLDETELERILKAGDAG